MKKKVFRERYYQEVDKKPSKVDEPIKEVEKPKKKKSEKNDSNNTDK